MKPDNYIIVNTKTRKAVSEAHYVGGRWVVYWGGNADKDLVVSWIKAEEIRQALEIEGVSVTVEEAALSPNAWA